jgi:hypothetical protein
MGSSFLIPKSAYYIQYIGTYPANNGNKLLDAILPCMLICMPASLNRA